MKTLLVFCISVFIFNSAYAELSRKDLVAYTLDFYAEDGAQSGGKTVKQEENKSLKGFSETKPKKAQQIKGASKKKDNKTSSREKAIEKALDKKSKKLTKVKSQIKQKDKPYGTKLSFSKATDKPAEEVVASKKEEPKKISNEKETALLAEEKPNYIKGVLKNTHPYAIGIGEFNDNIYHIKGDGKYDYITKLYPGINIKSKTTKKNFDGYFNGGFEILRYAKNNQHNTESPFAEGYLKYGFGKVAFVTAASAKRYRSTPSDLANDETPAFIDYWRDEMSQDFKLNFNRFDVDLQYNRTLYGYEEEEYKKSNRIKDVIALRNSVQIFPKTKLFLEYAHGWVKYDKYSASNYSYDRPLIGLNGKIFRKLVGTIKVGYNFNKRKNLKDLNGTLFYSMLTYRATPRLHYNFSAVKGLGSINLINEGVTKYQGASIGCSYLPPFLKKLKLTTNVGYWQRGSDYETKDNYWQVSFKPEYKLKEWLLLGLGYYFENRSSKSQENDYRNNRIEMSVVSEF